MRNSLWEIIQSALRFLRLQSRQWSDRLRTYQTLFWSGQWWVDEVASTLDGVTAETHFSLIRFISGQSLVWTISALSFIRSFFDLGTLIRNSWSTFSLIKGGLGGLIRDRFRLLTSTWEKMSLFLWLNLCQFTPTIPLKMSGWKFIFSSNKNEYFFLFRNPVDY